MGDISHSDPTTRDRLQANGAPTASANQSSEHAFQSQLDDLNQSDARFREVEGLRTPAFDMNSLAHTLPQSPHSAGFHGHSHFESTNQFGPASRHQPHSPQQHAYAGNRLDSAAQAQYMGTPLGIMAFQPRQPMSQLPMGGHVNPSDSYGYGMGQVSPQFMDPRFAPHVPFGMHGMHGMPNMPSNQLPYMRRPSESTLAPAPIPSYPRGPPRKPKQSGHALWVGNLPPGASVMDLKDHFSRDATEDIESLFLISKSNCAFVNYRSEAACIAAMNRFHDSRFQSVRLVCRLRRGAATGQSAVAGLPHADGAPDFQAASDDAKDLKISPITRDPDSPLIVETRTWTTANIPTTANDASATERIPEKYFIVKSLTTQDLESSVRNGIWATQTHNESALNEAFRSAENVYLVFSANKSGEYFGYARMTSEISGEPVSLSSMPTSTEPLSAGTPHSTATPATATAPRGYIIDDSARGTIFWEAERPDEDEDEIIRTASYESVGDKNWGKQFSIEWISTSRLPFYRTRGLRNPWNSNREVKIARDGTELETGIGRRLVQMFHGPAPMSATSQPSMPYR